MPEQWKSVLSGELVPFPVNQAAPAAYPALPLAPVARFDEHVDLLAQGLGVPRFLALLFARAIGLEHTIDRFETDARALETYLRSSIRGSHFFSLVQSATVVLADEPGAGAGLQLEYALARAARLAHAAHAIGAEFAEGTLAPERYGEWHGEMFQFWNLFGTSLMPTKKGFERRRAVTRLRYAAVLLRGALHCLPLTTADGVALPPGSIHHGLRTIANAAPSYPDSSPCVLSASEPRHARAALALVAGSCPDFAAAIERAEFVLALDLDETPPTPLECGRLVQVGNPGNRWYLSGLNLVVTGGGRAGALFSFGAGIDGNVMSRFASELGLRAANTVLEPAPAASPPPLAVPSTLPPSRRARSARRRVQQTLEAYRTDVVREHRVPFGRARLRAAGLKPVEAFSMALQCAVLEQTEGTLGVCQLVSQNRFRWGTLGGALVDSAESRRLCESLRRCRATGERPSGAEWALYQLAETQASAATASVRNSLFLTNRDVVDSELRFAAAFFSLVMPYKLATMAASRVARLRKNADGRAPAIPVMMSHPPTGDWAVFGRPGARAPGYALWLHYRVLSDETTILFCLPSQHRLDDVALANDVGHYLGMIESLASEHGRASMRAPALAPQGQLSTGTM